MLRRLLIIVILWCFAPKIFAQMYVNPGVDTTGKDARAALQFYNRYLEAFTDNKKPDYREYWSAADCKTYQVPDPVVYGINSDIPTYALGGTPTVLYIKPLQGYVRIKTQFSWADTAGNISTLAVTNHYVRINEAGKPEFVSPLTLAAGNWRSTTVRNITFHYPSYHSFDRRKADSLISRISTLEKEWSLQPIAINYYFADANDEIQALRGFDFSLGAGNVEKPSGISNDTDNIIYCSGLGENYFHEVVHIYLNRLFSRSPLREGLAIFYGGSMGHDLNWHIKRMNDYINLHPEIDLNKPDDFWNMDIFTNSQSTIKGLLCKAVYDKEGIPGLKRLLGYQDTTAILTKEFKFAPGNFNAGIRELIRSMALKK